MSNKRMTKDEYYLSIAEVVSKRSTCLRRQYGAVIVKNDEIISTGYNGAARGEPNCCDVGECDRMKLNIPSGQRYELCVAIHAEANAIMSASRERANGATIYIAGRNVEDDSYANPSPCLMCRRNIVNAGISRCVGLKDGKPVEIDLEPPTHDCCR